MEREREEEEEEEREREEEKETEGEEVAAFSLAAIESVGHASGKCF